MKYETVLQGKDEVRVEAIDHDSEGECYVTSFFGLRAMERAKEYAAWKNGSSGDTCVKCQKALPPVATWSGPACPECTEAAEENSPLEPAERHPTTEQIVEAFQTAYPPEPAACPKCDAVRKLGLTSCFEHKQPEKAAGESRAEFERDRGFVRRCLKCGEELGPDGHHTHDDVPDLL